MTEITFWVDSF